MATSGGPPRLGRAEVALLTVAVPTLAHQLDHVLRADASGWPFTRDLTWFTASLVVHPALVAGLNGRAIDFAKLGALYLHGGVWRGRQLVPRRWVAGSTRADTRTDPSPWFEYGWWTRPDPPTISGPKATTASRPRVPRP
jgi:CubicO group peptidase (beta-lactamase class C family)